MAQALGLGAGFKALLPTLAIIYGGQAIASVPAIAYKTEKVSCEMTAEGG